MNSKPRVVWFVCAWVFGIAGQAQGDWSTVINPNTGLALSPRVAYDPVDGMVYLENVGSDGVVDSLDNSTLLGDDIGMIAILLSVDVPMSFPAGVLSPYLDGVAWNTPQIFGGKIQLQGTAVIGQFLRVSDTPTAIFRLAPGATLENFSYRGGGVSLEMGVNFWRGHPGATLFDADAGTSGNFRVLPEPTSWVGLLLGFVLLDRRKNRRGANRPIEQSD